MKGLQEDQLGGSCNKAGKDDKGMSYGYLVYFVNLASSGSLDGSGPPELLEAFNAGPGLCS